MPMTVTWDADMIRKAHELCLPERTVSLDIVADKIGVNRDTLVRWMRRNNLSTEPPKHRPKTHAPVRREGLRKELA